MLFTICKTFNIIIIFYITYILSYIVHFFTAVLYLVY